MESNKRLSSPPTGPAFGRPDDKLRRGPSTPQHCRGYSIPAFAGMTLEDGRREAPGEGAFAHRDRRRGYGFAVSSLIMSLRVTVTHLVVTGGPPPPMCQAA
jgi:hypothetical protein